MYNFCELVTSHVATHYQSEKYVYQTNFSAAVHICRLFLRGSVAPPDAETNISRNLVPVRPNRKAPRILNRPRFVSVKGTDVFHETVKYEKMS